MPRVKIQRLTRIARLWQILDILGRIVRIHLILVVKQPALNAHDVRALLAHAALLPPIVALVVGAAPVKAVCLVLSLRVPPARLRGFGDADLPPGFVHLGLAAVVGVFELAGGVHDVFVVAEGG